MPMLIAPDVPIRDVPVLRPILPLAPAVDAAEVMDTVPLDVGQAPLAINILPPTPLPLMPP